MKNEQQNPPALLLLVLPALVIWGCNFAVIKVGVEAVGPFLLAAMRFFIASFPFIFFIARPRLPVGYIVAFGLTFGLGQFFLLFTAIQLGLPSGMASLLLQLQAVFTPLLGWMILRKTLTKPTVLAIAVSFSGLGFIISESSGGAVALIPVLFGIGAALCWAASNMVVSFASVRGYRYAPLSLVVWASAGLPLPFLALAWVSGEFEHIAAPDLVVALPAALYLGVIATLVAYQLWVKALSVYTAFAVAPFSLLIPIIGLCVGWLAFGESLSGIEAIGCLLVVAGLLKFARATRLGHSLKPANLKE